MNAERVTHPIRRYTVSGAQVAENVRLNAVQEERDRRARESTPQPKAPERGKVPHGSKDHEIENLKRLLADVSKRLDKLK